MSWKATGHVLDLAARFPQLTVTQMAILYALAARHNHEYHCAWGTIKRIAADAHVHPVTVSTTITELEELGLVAVYEGQLPRKKSDPEDRRLTRGTLWCLIGLDPDGGPDVVGVAPRVRTGGRPIYSVSPRLTEFEELDDGQLAGSGESVSRGLRDELAGLNSPFLTGSLPVQEPELLALQANNEPEREPVARALEEAPPQRAEHMEPDVGDVPPRWQEIVPGVHHGLPDGKGEVVLLKARCPRCGHAFPIGDLDSGEIPEHDCQPVFAPIDPRPRSPGNLGGHLRRARHRSEPIPPEVHAELARMAGNRPTPEQIAADLERVGLARAGPSPEPSAPSTNGHSVPAGGTTRDEDRDDRT